MHAAQTTGAGHPRRPSRGGRLPLALALLLAAATVRPLAGRAQAADVPRPDGQGDFPSLAVPGARGSFPHRYWLVVDPDPRGLTCRDGAGRPLLALRPGALLETHPGDSLLLLQGRPWLRVRVRPRDILRDSRTGERGRGTGCWVRASRAYLAPVLADSLESLLQERSGRPR